MLKIVKFILLTYLSGLVIVDIRVVARISRSRFSEPYINHLSNMRTASYEIPPNLIGMDISSKTDVPGEPLNPDDFREAKAMIEINTHALTPSGEDPTMMAGRFQGDIILETQERAAELSNNVASDEPQRNAIIEDTKKWANGVIPYVISASYDKAERAVIAKALSEFHSSTCIRFVPRTSDPDYIFITKGAGCSSAVGRVGGEQQVSLGDGCVYFGTAVHELMHAAGFWHEQSRSDRDDYVTVVYANIIPGMEYNFQKYSWDIIQSLGVSYDTGSIMHYGPTAFAVDRAKPTIISRSGSVIGQRNALSTKDKAKLNALYQCANGGTSTVTTAPIVTTAPPAGDCVDGNIHCEYWSSIGECKKNPSWMNNNCKKSCKQCEEQCKDDNVNCDAWSVQGECRNSPSYMHKHCKKACGLCHSAGAPSGTACLDENEYCPSWAASGECRVNPDYMSKWCAKSCNTCK